MAVQPISCMGLSKSLSAPARLVTVARSSETARAAWDCSAKPGREQGEGREGGIA